MTSSPASELHALLDRERSLRRAAEDWATFLVATLDSYIRASHEFDVRIRLAESGPASRAGAVRCYFENNQRATSQRQDITGPTRLSCKIIYLLIYLLFYLFILSPLRMLCFHFVCLFFCLFDSGIYKNYSSDFHTIILFLLLLLLLRLLLCCGRA